MNRFFFIFFLFTLVQARGEAGAWERLFLWRAYELEVSTTGGRTTNIAKGCVGTGPGGSCNINEFVQYINNMQTKPNIVGSSLNDLADSINKGYVPNTKDPNVLTGEKNDYEKLRILDPTSKQTPSQKDLFRLVAQHTSDVWNGIQQPTAKQAAIMDDIRESLRNVRLHRSREWSVRFKNTVAKNGKTVVTKTNTIAGKKYANDFDLHGTARANNPGGYKALKQLTALHNQDKISERHWLIINSVEKASKVLNKCQLPKTNPKTKRRAMGWMRRWTESFSGVVDHLIEIGAKIGPRFLGHFEGLNAVL